jgi:hypothetical protein
MAGRPFTLSILLKRIIALSVKKIIFSMRREVIFERLFEKGVPPISSSSLGFLSTDLSEIDVRRGGAVALRPIIAPFAAAPEPRVPTLFGSSSRSHSPDDLDPSGDHGLRKSHTFLWHFSHDSTVVFGSSI